MTYSIVVTETALSMLDAIQDCRLKRLIRNRIDRLASQPDQQGKPLVGPLRGLYSVRTGGRYRIIYKVFQQKVVVFVVAIGIRKDQDRKDIYTVARKLAEMEKLE